MLPGVLPFIGECNLLLNLTLENAANNGKAQVDIIADRSLHPIPSDPIQCDAILDFTGKGKQFVRSSGLSIEGLEYRRCLEFIQFKGATYIPRKGGKPLI